MIDINELVFDERGLIPCVVQDIYTNEVLMLAYMNKESLKKTLETGYTWYYSRSRKELWKKGATSGHLQKVRELSYDCDKDTILAKVEQTGVACHTGEKSCFHNYIMTDSNNNEANDIGVILNEVYEVIKNRQAKRPEKSYTTYLFNEGQDKILKKIGEEASEIIIASKNNDNAETIYESADFIYHLLVLLKYHDITINELAAELKKRR